MEENTTTPEVEPKGAIQSKTIIFNVLTLAGSLATMFLGLSTAEVAEITAVAISVVNIALRFWTKEPLVLRK